MAWCIIPARGGSKGIPRKNLRQIAGLPLIVHSIRHAQASESVSRVIVSTDDAEIARVANAHGAEVVERPEDLSGDEATSESALAHALDHLRESDGSQPDLVVFLQCTSPVRTASDIDTAVNMVRAQGVDSVLSVAPFHRFVWRDTLEGPESTDYAPGERPRRQDLAPRYVENGSIYVFRPEGLKAHGSRLHGRIGLHVMDYWSAFEIDEPSDLALCDWILRRQAQRVPIPTSIRLLVLDFDGVLTDNRVWVGEDGREMVAAHRGDGLGIEEIRRAGIEVVVLSKERNPVVAVRCEKLGIECRHGIDDKPVALEKLLQERSISSEEVAFVGNDVNDVGCMSMVGLSAAPSDAHPEALRVADLILSSRGGYGAVRELCDMILKSRRGDA